jgi:hypothetical protein
MWRAAARGSGDKSKKKKKIKKENERETMIKEESTCENEDKNEGKNNL